VCPKPLPFVPSIVDRCTVLRVQKITVVLCACGFWNCGLPDAGCGLHYRYRIDKCAGTFVLPFTFGFVTPERRADALPLRILRFFDARWRRATASLIVTITLDTFPDTNDVRRFFAIILFHYLPNYHWLPLDTRDLSSRFWPVTNLRGFAGYTHTIRFAYILCRDTALRYCETGRGAAVVCSTGGYCCSVLFCSLPRLPACNLLPSPDHRYAGISVPILIDHTFFLFPLHFITRWFPFNCLFFCPLPVRYGFSFSFLRGYRVSGALTVGIRCTVRQVTRRWWMTWIPSVGARVWLVTGVCSTVAVRVRRYRRDRCSVDPAVAFLAVIRCGRVFGGWCPLPLIAGANICGFLDHSPLLTAVRFIWVLLPLLLTVFYLWILDWWCTTALLVRRDIIMLFFGN